MLRALPPAAAVVLSAVWYAYVSARFDGWPAAPAGELLRLPLTGWRQTLRNAASHGLLTFDRVGVGQAAVPIVVVVGFGLFVGIVRALRLHNPIHIVYLAFMPVVLGLNWLNLLYTKDPCGRTRSHSPSCPPS